MPDMVSPEEIPPLVDAIIIFWLTQGVYNPLAMIEIIELRSYGYLMTELHVCHRMCKDIEIARVPAEPWDINYIVARITETLSKTQQELVLAQNAAVRGIIAKVRLAVPGGSIIHANHCLSM